VAVCAFAENEMPIDKMVAMRINFINIF